MQVLVLLTLIVLNGLFAMAEIALVTARKARLQKLIDAGDTAAAAALALGQNPTRFLSTIQIGITSIGVLNGVFGEAALAQPLGQWLMQWGLSSATASATATTLVVVVLTYGSIVIGELVPKRIGQSRPEAIARLVARPVHWLALLTRPFVYLLSLSTEGILRLLGVQTDSEPAVTEDEIHAMLAEGITSGVIEVQEHRMVRNLFRLDDRQISSLMVPRADLVCIDINAPFAQQLAVVAAHDHARFPVMDGGMDNIVGVVNARQWLLRVMKAECPLREIPEVMERPVYIPETISGLELLENFQQHGARLAFVIDEYGEVLGAVALRDVIEAITGEFASDDPSQAWAVQRSDGSWLLDGHIPVYELKDRLNLKTLPDEDKGRYQTLSGMLMLLTGRVPTETDTVQWQGWEFEVVDMDGKVIDKVQARWVGEGG